ncbi:MAG: mevalonate kinase [Candidatus Aenigmatarchaeota archaeon]
MITVSSPGKVHLIGEHAVVYGEPAIIAAIGKRTIVKAKKSNIVSYTDKRFNSTISWALGEVKKTTEETINLWHSCFEKKDFSELFKFIKNNGFMNYKKTIVGIVLNKLNIMGGVSLTIDSNIPIGAGLGSSSSLAVALVKAIAELYGKKISLDKINEIAYELEKIIHGTPSGGDNSACCFGSLIWFRKAQPKNEIVSLKKEIPYKLENFVLVYTKPPEKTTGELVQLVRNLDEKYRNKRVKKIGKLVYEMRDVLKKKNFERMKEIINENQKILAELGVSCKEIDKISKAVKKIGGAAKLCGAGGGGVVLCYHEDKKKLIETIKSFGFEPWETELAVEGVRIEK